MASLKDYIQREIQMQRRLIQSERTQGDLNQDRVQEEFEIEFQCIKKIVEAENPIQDTFFLSVDKRGWNDLTMQMRVERRAPEVVIEESVYRGQTIRKEKVVNDSKTEFLGGTKVVWLPGERKWAYQYDQTDGAKGLHIVGSSEMLLNMFMDYSTKKIADVLEAVTASS